MFTPSFIETNSAQLAYYRVGRGPDIVCVHGWPLSAVTYRQQVEALSSQYTCHLFDLPGAGLSRWKEGAKMSPQGQVLCLLEALDILNLSNFAMVGHDAGGGVVRLCAAALGSEVAGIALLNTELSNYHSGLFKLFMLNIQKGGPKVIRLGFKLGFLRRSATAFGAFFSDPKYGEGEFFELLIKPFLDENQRLVDMVSLFDEYDAQEDARQLKAAHRQIHCPVQLIWGEEDRAFPLDKAQQMLGEFAGPADLVSVPGAKLFLHEDHPEPVNRYLLSFFRKIFAQQSRGSEGVVLSLSK